MTTWEKIEIKRSHYDTMFEREFKRSLMGQVEGIAESINSTFINDYERALPILISSFHMQETFIKLYQVVGLAFRDQFMQSLKRHKISGYNKKSMEDDIWLEQMKQYAELVLSGRVAMMDKTTKDILLKMIRDSIQEGTDNGFGIEKLTSKIRNDLFDKYPEFAKYRARRIAMTETGTASNYASYRSAAESGVPMKKRWLTAPVGIAKTERHNLVVGLTEQRPMINDYFQVDYVQMLHPHDPNGGAEHTINCRCAIGYETL